MPSNRELQREDFKKHSEKTCLNIKGFDCEIIKNRGYWCGYINIPLQIDNHVKEHMEEEMPVHGGITYFKSNKGKTKIGFDCSHYMDYSKELDSEKEDDIEDDKTYFRTYDYVLKELQNGIDWLIAESI